MAQSTGDAETVGADVQLDTELGEAWEEHKQHYDTKAEALRAGLRSGLLEDGADVERADLSPLQIGVFGLAAGALGALIAQAAYVWDTLVASGLTAVAVLTILAVTILLHGD